VLLAFEPPDGGVAENVVQLALGLSRHGFEVELAGPLSSPVYERLSGIGVRSDRLPFVRGYGRPLTDAKALGALTKLLVRGKFDLLHCHSAKAGVLGRLAGRLAATPVVYSPHCLPFVGEFGAARRVFATSVERALARSTAAMICVSEHELGCARDAGLRTPVLRVVRNGTEPADRAIEVDARLRALREHGPVAATLSVLRQQKRIDVFLDAAPAVLAAVPEARLAVIGDGPLANELAEQARALGLDGEPRFAFIPYAGPAARYLLGLDLYVLSSSWESMPIGVLEALACGVPQVATDAGGTAEAVSPATGVIVPRNDPDALARALIELLGDSASRQRMAEASVERHRALFGVERMASETAAVYESVLASR
jgi:glycosyltransferase involved in cell wall biosynthesis